MAESVRSAIRAYLKKNRSSDGFMALAGRFTPLSSAPGDVSDHDQWWVNAITEEKVK